MGGVISLKDACLPFAQSLKTSFTRDRRKTVGASEIGLCARRVVYGKLGLVPDEDQPSDTGFTTRGNVMEDAWSAPLLAHWASMNGGSYKFGGQANQVELEAKGVPLSSTPDGIAVDMPRDCLALDGLPDIGPSKCVVAEIKSIDPRYKSEKLPKQAHVPQVMAQLGLIRKALPYKPDYGFVFYVDASDYFDLKPFFVKYDEKQFKSLVKRADSIMKCDDPNKMAPEGKMRGGKECSECPFARQCLGYKPYLVDEDPSAPTSAQVKAVEKIAEKVAALSTKEAEAKAAKLQAEGDLYLKLGEIKRKFIQGKGFTVVAKTTKSQNRTDAKKLIALLKDKGATDAEIELCKSETKEGTSLSVERIG